MENEDTKKKKETDGSTPQRHRKAGLKFAPRVVPKKDPKITPKIEPQEESKPLTIDKELMARLGSLQSNHGPGSGTKAEKQGTAVQVAFGQADPSIPRTFPTPRSFSSGVSGVKLPKEYDEPWDYTTNYPITLPLRRPYSGDPEILDEEEFGHSSGRAQDGELNAAQELGLMERADTPQLLFFQFPTALPLPRQGDPVAETKTDTDVNINAKSMGHNRKRRLDSIQGCDLKELPGGLMGKILVYRSGKVKMTLGDVLFDVSAGSNCTFHQEVAAIDTREKHCCGLGEIGKRAVVTPDVASLLGSIEKM
ncbi:hypothetical protein BAE44_0006202 [Dichanthelium oligosanthes]|uniref:DNA-directed RNA polymerase III subunit RPC4 n=1 Tax=Dichanthelium oligosanthes TaxID=888268 RepID=A0A1E5W6C5_9POAL|nr:hypothetical protein BAE44_0006202 [Dichanthelium oligosanthes]